KTMKIKTMKGLVLIYMKSPQTNVIKEISVKDKIDLSNQLSAPLFYLPEVVEQKTSSIPTVLQKKKRSVTLRVIKRLTPFLFIAFFLPLFFVYRIIAEEENIPTKLLLCFLFVVLEVNLLYSDFALRNYFNRQKLFFAWIIEICFTITIVLIFL
ncbi:MAG TPA: hypothetical protein VN958_06295, partial [Chitinophagaceae bacterium]|nr:hypothetical protein [Chitinophagaceae bacterium]